MLLAGVLAKDRAVYVIRDGVDEACAAEVLARAQAIGGNSPFRCEPNVTITAKLGSPQNLEVRKPADGPAGRPQRGSLSRPPMAGGTAPVGILFAGIGRRPAELRPSPSSRTGVERWSYCVRPKITLSL